jgi:hypothetical protein
MLDPDRPNPKASRQWWACPKCHRVVWRLTEVAELQANAEIRHVVCDTCISELRANDPVVVLDFIGELGRAS